MKRGRREKLVVSILPNLMRVVAGELHFKEYAEKYLQEKYRIGVHWFSTTNVQFLASLPDSLGNLVLDELTLKGMTVDSMLLLDLIQRA